MKKMDPAMKVEVLLKFWEEGLISPKILKKLLFKEESGKHKLSDKEQRLKLFLQGENKQLLLELEADSTTRKYGELAVLPKNELHELLVDHFAISNKL